MKKLKEKSGIDVDLLPLGGKKTRIPENLEQKKATRATLPKGKPDFVPACYDKRGRPRKTTRTVSVTAPPRPKKRKVCSASDKEALIQEWYGYLKQTGFRDLEWYNPKKGADTSQLLQGTSMRSIADRYAPQREFYYYMLRNFAAHADRYTYPNRQLKFCFEQHLEGVSYREIAELLKIKAAKWKSYNARSYFWVFTNLKPLIEKALLWNREHPEGLMHPAQSDVYIEDVLLREDKVAAYREQADKVKPSQDAKTKRVQLLFGSD